MSKNKLKYIDVSPEDAVKVYAEKVVAEVKDQREYGVLFSFVEFVEDEVSVILFLEPHHSNRDIEIASARIQALHFFDRMLAVAAEEIPLAA